jgi:hypothetical protein
MKTVQDWGFISKDQGLVKPKLQDNKIFHALTSAYENNQQQEIYGATENIVRREKEMCELALADLRKLAEGKGEADATLKLIMDHYQSRLAVAKEKEEKINHLSEDSRKMTEEYKKKTQELADVKRNLMESQGKLRELAKTTEKLIKREEELRFIESNLRSELDKNKRNIINGLYEIVADLPEPVGLEALPAAAALAAPAPQPAAPLPRPVENAPVPAFPGGLEDKRPFHEGLFRSAPEANPFAKPLPETPKEMAWSRDEAHKPAPLFRTAEAAPPAVPSPNALALQSAPAAPVILKPGDLQEKAIRLKMFEPGKAMCSKSMVKTADGEVISEYFYAPTHAKESRHYIFNTLFALSSLLTLKAKDEEQFLDRMETLFTDLLSRLEHGRNIHLESFLGEEMNRDTLDRLLGQPRRERGAAFDLLAAKVLARIESVGPARAGLIDQQFRQMPKSDFPPGKGIAA